MTISRIETSSELDLHLNKLSESLGNAFFDDGYYTHIMPNSKVRSSQIQWWMKILLKYSQKYGSIYVTSDYTGAAMWLGPDNPAINNFHIARIGLILYPFKVGFANFFKMLNLTTEWEKEHAKQKKRHYYLMVIGVDTKSQRKGIGSLLMEDVLRRADNEKLDCYLETVEECNVEFYKRHNFQVIYNKPFGKDKQYWLMRRTP